MYNEGVIIRRSDLADPTSGRLSQILKKFSLFMFKPTYALESFEDSFILIDFLKVCTLCIYFFDYNGIQLEAAE